VGQVNTRTTTHPAEQAELNELNWSAAGLWGWQGESERGEEGKSGSCASAAIGSLRARSALLGSPAEERWWGYLPCGLCCMATFLVTGPGG